MVWIGAFSTTNYYSSRTGTLSIYFLGTASPVQGRLFSQPKLPKTPSRSQLVLKGEFPHHRPIESPQLSSMSQVGTQITSALATPALVDFLEAGGRSTHIHCEAICVSPHNATPITGAIRAPAKLRRFSASSLGTYRLNSIH